MEILTLRRHPRVQPVQAIVVHVNVGPEVEGGAIGLAHYTAHEIGGYHMIVDDKTVVVTAHDDETTNGATGGNAFGYHVCLVGYANQTAAQWADPYSAAERTLAAQVVADACLRFGVQPARLSPFEITQIAQGHREITGICGHVDVTASANMRGIPNEGHYDPGPNFPMGEFVTRVHQIRNPAIFPPEPQIVSQYLVSKEPLQKGDGPSALVGKIVHLVVPVEGPIAFPIPASQISKYSQKHFVSVPRALVRNLDIHL